MEQLTLPACQRFTGHRSAQQKEQDETPTAATANPTGRNRDHPSAMPTNLQDSDSSDKMDSGLAAMSSADPVSACRGIMSRDLLRLSTNERTALEEEIHGVRSLAPEETTSLVEDSLRRLAIELEKVLPNSKKQAYLTAQKQSDASRKYVGDPEFRLRFLRAELFDVQRAALRMTKSLECLLHMFGPYALERPIKLSDFAPAELKAFREGWLQILPYRDRAGRRIVFLSPNVSLDADNFENWTKLRIQRVKIFLYVSYVLSEDVESQRNGIVLLFWVDRMREWPGGRHPGASKHLRGLKANSVFFVRCGALHICTPNTPRFRVLGSIVLLGLGRHRLWARIHWGEHVEIRYYLQGFGIAADTIPKSWTGTIKLQYFRQWLKIRQHLESSSIYTDGSVKRVGVDDPSAPIEAPGLKDVLFKKGKSASQHPGNVRFRSMIQDRYEIERSRAVLGGDQGFQSMPYGAVGSGGGSGIKWLVAAHFMDEFREGNLRALIWNEKQSWWHVLSNEKQIQKKVDHAVNSLRVRVATPGGRMGDSSSSWGLLREANRGKRGSQELLHNLPAKKQMKPYRYHQAGENHSVFDVRSEEGCCEPMRIGCVD